jgi:hypothetical protein
MAAGPIVVDDLEDNASVKIRRCVMRHVTELATHQLGVPFDLYGSHHFENRHVRTVQPLPDTHGCSGTRAQPAT